MTEHGTRADEAPSVWSIAERAFVDERRADWDALEQIVRVVETKKIQAVYPAEVVRLPALYRRVCADLGVATSARYSAPIRTNLEALTARAHAVVYASSDASLQSAGDLATRIAEAFVAFPRAVARRRGFMLLATVLLFGPLIAALFAALHEPVFAFRLMPATQLRALQHAYDAGFDGGRQDGSGAAMTGFYVQHNVGIALRGLALGIFGGVGSALTLVFNGVATGAVFGYVAAHGAGANILTFVVGHGAFELGAIVLAGGAGMALGWALVAPGERTRLASVQAIAPDIITIATGAAVMLCFAAAIEGMWSASSIASTVKRAVGVFNLTLLVVYLVFGSRIARRDAKRARRR